MQEERRQRATAPGRRVRITVNGRLSEQLAAAFDELELVGRRGQTDLVGDVVDQAHLYGLLARIRDLGLELESLSFPTSTDASTVPFTTDSEVHRP